jgi:IS5 family transposase
MDLRVRAKGVAQAKPDLETVHRERIKAKTKAQRRWLKRRRAAEPAIGHLKSDNRMQRCCLQGETGDALQALRCAEGYSLRWLIWVVPTFGRQRHFAVPVLAGVLGALGANDAEVGHVRFSDRAWVHGVYSSTHLERIFGK